MAHLTLENAEIPLEVFEIYLHREQYFPGEVVTGKLLITTCRKIKTEGIYIKFEGKAQAKWTKRPAYLCGLQEAEFVKGENAVFSNIFRYALGILPEGSSAFPFEFELPNELPPSITGLKQVRILYSVDALIRTKMEDFRQSKYFGVKTLLNLTAYPELSLPFCKTVRESMHESCWSWGQLVVFSFIIRKQGFVHGELIKTDLIIKDLVYVATTTPGIKMHLIQEMEIKLKHGTRVRRRICAKNYVARFSNIDERTCKFTFLLKIPDDILISFGSTTQDFVNIQYFLRISMERSVFPYKPFQIIIPIKIGSIWIKEQTFPIFRPVPTSHKMLPSKNNHEDDDESSQPLPLSPPEILSEQSSKIDSSKMANIDSPRRRQGTSIISNLSKSTNIIRDSCASLFKPHEAFTAETTPSGEYHT